MKAYTGVGSRSTPQEIGILMYKLAQKLGEKGWVLRSGGAEGADTFFQEGWFSADRELFTTAEIYIPWAGFNNLFHGQWDAVYSLTELGNKTKAEEIASEIHPAWDKCSRGAKALHTRNVYQVLGNNLASPSNFLICWAEVDKQGKPKGGTRTAGIVTGKQFPLL